MTGRVLGRKTAQKALFRTGLYKIRKTSISMGSEASMADARAILEFAIEFGRFGWKSDKDPF
jgi:hypothetical protein